MYFGIVKELKEKINCELFAGIDDNNFSKEFYSNQKIVNFKKIFFYGDYIKNKFEEVDLKYLEEFEKKYKINLWNLIYSDRTLHNYNQYYKFSKEESLAIIQFSCRFLEKMLEEINPDCIIMDLSAFHQDVILESICKIKKIRIMCLSQPRFRYTAMISQEPDAIDSDDIKSHDELNGLRTFEEVLEHIKGYSKQQKIFFKKYNISLKTRISAGSRFLSSTKNSDYIKYYPNYGKTNLRIIQNQMKFLIKRIYRTDYLKRICEKSIPENKKFIYFPLHYQPERSTLIQAPYWVNQLEVIRNISKSIPIEYVLCVKEHPLMNSLGWRNTDYYKQIKELPNVKLIHHSLSNEEVIKHASLIITITGTAGLEAVFYQKPAIIFGKTIYSEIPGVFKIKSLNELSITIKKALETKIDVRDVTNFVSKIENNSFSFDIAGLYTDMLQKFQFSGFSSLLDISQDKMQDYLEEKKKLFSTLADEFVKKINHVFH